MPGVAAVQWAGAITAEGISPLRGPWGAEHPAIDIASPVAIVEEQPGIVALNE